MACEVKFTKLPEIAKPQVYDIFLKPCLKTFQCQGQSTISLKLLEKSNFVKLHANELVINSVSATLADGTVFKDLKIEVDNKWSFLTVNFPKELDPQEMKMDFDFIAELNTKMQGFSRSSYKDAVGNEKFLASTQFESTYARTCFPCWDEPIYKATFNITLEVDEKLTALSNMNVIDTKLTSSATKTLKYATTPLMSTYLLAFAVGDFEYIETKTDSGIVVRVYTIPGKKEQGHYALDLSKNCLTWYSKWFDIPCNLPKVDLIAIPDFAMGAMENWGLITCREVALLCDPAKTSTLAKIRVAEIVSHELAHFWFGNLVTMKWWSDLWLKEGFASLMEYIYMNENIPEFRIWLQFLRNEHTFAFALDGLRNSHPIEVEIDNPNELDEIYDSITYSKANSINKMLYDFLSPEVFQSGLQLYLKKYQYSNAVTNDLWDCFSEVSKKNVKKLMSSWTKQMGFPMVTVLEQRIDGKKRYLKLSQSRFILDGGEDHLNSIWEIPISIITSADPSTPKTKISMNQKEQEFVLEDIGEKDWIKLNAATSGFYRVKYTKEMFEALLPAIRSKQLPVLDRYGFTEDVVALVEAGKLKVDGLLDILKYFADEDEYTVWGAVDQIIGTIAKITQHSDDQKLEKVFNNMVISVLSPIMENKLGYFPKPNEDSHVGLLRALIMSRLAKCNEPKIIEFALKQFEEHVFSGVELVPELRSLYYSIAARQNNTKLLQDLKKIFKTVNFSEIELNCIMAMSQVTAPELLKEVFNYCILEKNVRPQDLSTLFAGARFSKAGNNYAWNFFKENYQLFLQLFGSVNSSVFQRCLKYATNSLSDESAGIDVQNFLKENCDCDSLKVLERPIGQIVESININARLYKDNIDVLRQYLKL